MGGGATALAHGGGRRFGGLVPSGWAVGFGNAGEIPAGFGPDAVTPAGATIPSWRVSVVFTPHLPPRAGGTLGLVRAAASSASHSFLEVLLGMRRAGAMAYGRTWMEGAAVTDHLCLPSCRCWLLFLLLFPFWACCAVRPGYPVIGVWCFII